MIFEILHCLLDVVSPIFKSCFDVGKIEIMRRYVQIRKLFQVYDRSLAYHYIC